MKRLIIKCGVLFAIIVLISVMVINLLMETGLAEREHKIMYAFCKSTSYVNIRKSPSTQSEAVGIIYCGSAVELDGKTKGSWVHIVNGAFEEGSGWINKDYLVSEKPESYEKPLDAEVDTKTLIVRKKAGGEGVKRLKQGTKVKVYSVSEVWAIIDEGFVKVEYLLFLGQGGQQ